jgi:proton-dependent oligopeptide transporter, POT family
MFGEFKRHPKGLYILFFTEMWERFSYYGMRAILVLYIVAKVKEGPLGGLGWNDVDALSLYGTYTMMVYLMSIPGGIIADKLLGQKKTVLIGGILLVAGHSILAIHGIVPFYTGLVLIILGVGGLKPNISTMVGGLYKKGDIKRDEGFTIFYIGINVGAFLSSVIVGYIGETIGWHYGFGLAGIGMALGLCVYLYGQKYLKNVGEKIKEVTPSDVKGKELFSKMLKDITALSLAVLFSLLGIYALIHGDILYAFLIILGAVGLGMGVVVYKSLSPVERDRVKVMLISFLIIIVFWGAYEQAGGLMNLYTKDKIDRFVFGFQIPASVFQAVNPLIIMLCGTAVASYWIRRNRKGKEESGIFKMAIGTIIMGSGFLLMSAAAIQANSSASGKAGLYWLIGAYFLHTIGELCSSPVSLSYITKLAPARFGSIMMGLYFAATGLGNKLAGEIGEASQTLGDLQTFTLIAVFVMFFGGLLLVFLKKLKAMSHGAEDVVSDEELYEEENFEASGLVE